MKLGILIVLCVIVGISRIIALIIEKSQGNKEKLNDTNSKENHEKLVANIAMIIIFVVFILFIILMFYVRYFQ